MTLRGFRANDLAGFRMRFVRGVRLAFRAGFARAVGFERDERRDVFGINGRDHNTPVRLPWQETTQCRARSVVARCSPCLASTTTRLASSTCCRPVLSPIGPSRFFSSRCARLSRSVSRTHSRAAADARFFKVLLGHNLILAGLVSQRSGGPGTQVQHDRDKAGLIVPAGRVVLAPNPGPSNLDRAFPFVPGRRLRRNCPPARGVGGSTNNWSRR